MEATAVASTLQAPSNVCVRMGSKEILTSCAQVRQSLSALNICHSSPVDINECSTNKGNCSDMCVNIIGSFLCTCPAGYQLNNTNNRTCIGRCINWSCFYVYILIFVS